MRGHSHPPPPPPPFPCLNENFTDTTSYWIVTAQVTKCQGAGTASRGRCPDQVQAGESSCKDELLTTPVPFIYVFLTNQSRRLIHSVLFSAVVRMMKGAALHFSLGLGHSFPFALALPSSCSYLLETQSLSPDCQALSVSRIELEF